MQQWLIIIVIISTTAPVDYTIDDDDDDYDDAKDTKLFSNVLKPTLSFFWVKLCFDSPL